MKITDKMRIDFLNRGYAIDPFANLPGSAAEVGPCRIYFNGQVGNLRPAIDAAIRADIRAKP